MEKKQKNYDRALNIVMFTTIPSWTTNSNCHGRVSLYEETVLENIEMLTNRKETKRAIQAAVDQANKVKKPAIPTIITHCARCGYAPKPDEWGNLELHYCIDCA